MRLAALAVAVLAVACTESMPEAAAPPAAPMTPQSMRVPQKTSQISGLVTRSEGGALLLDSGGPMPLPLQVVESTKVTVDGQPGTGAEIREGDLVRAAYRLDNAGAPLALLVVANTRPVQTERVSLQQKAALAQPR